MGAHGQGSDLQLIQCKTRLHGCESALANIGSRCVHVVSSVSVKSSLLHTHSAQRGSCLLLFWSQNQCHPCVQYVLVITRGMGRRDWGGTRLDLH